jgi:hypothetical protein
VASSHETSANAISVLRPGSFQAVREHAEQVVGAQQYAGIDEIGAVDKVRRGAENADRFDPSVAVVQQRGMVAAEGEAELYALRDGALRRR